MAISHRFFTVKPLALIIFFCVCVCFIPARADAASNHGLHLTVKANQILVFKKSRKLQLRLGDMILREYPIALGFNPKGHKQYEGDGRTPEGKYTISWKNLHSDFFLSLKISYPNKNDIRNARRRGDKPGSMIMIHGMPNDRTAADVGHPDKDWTNGCIAITDDEIIEVWEMVDEGTPITIYP